MKRTILAIAGIVMLIAGPTTLFFGCSAKDFVPVRTPAAAQETFGIAPSMSYREATQRAEVVTEQTRVALKQWSENIEESARWVRALSALQTAGIDLITDPSKIAAGGGLAAILASFAVGALGIRRPGDVPPADAQAKADAAWEEAKAEVLATINAKGEG